MKNFRILFICEGQLGDLIILTPAIREMKLSFPKSIITVMILQRRQYSNKNDDDIDTIRLNPENGTAGVLSNNAYVDKIIEINRSAIRSYKGIKRACLELKIIKLIRKEKLDIVICTFPQDRFVFWAFLSGAKIRVGQHDQKFSWLLTHTPDVQKEDNGVLKYYCELVVAAGASVNSYTTEYHITKASRKWASDFIEINNLNDKKGFVCIHPGASGLFKAWPPERFASVIKALKSDGNVNVLLCWTEYDKLLIAEVKKHLQEKVIEIDFEDSIDRFAAILEQSILCVSNDSGPRHLAVAVGTPTIAFMSRMKQFAWKIYDDEIRNVVLQGDVHCSLCTKEDCREIIPEGETFGAYCIRMITTEEALGKIRQIISTN